MADLLSLAARVEAAEGPDRELDALIESATSNRRPWSNPEITVPADQADYYEVPDGDYSGANLHLVGHPLMKADHPEGEWRRGPNGRPVVKNQNRHYAPRFTASLDAAMSLVPEGWTVSIHQQDNGWAANLQKGYRTSYTTVVFSERGPNGWPATPALALVAAALRARAEQVQP